MNRKFAATGPNQLWVADRSYVDTHAGWTDVAFVLGVFSRLIVGWQISTSLRTDLALDALDMELWTRQRAGRQMCTTKAKPHMEHPEALGRTAVLNDRRAGRRRARSGGRRPRRP